MLPLTLPTILSPFTEQWNWRSGPAVYCDRINSYWTKLEKGWIPESYFLPTSEKKLLEVPAAAQCYMRRWTRSPLAIRHSWGLSFQFSVSQQDRGNKPWSNLCCCILGSKWHRQQPWQTCKTSCKSFLGGGKALCLTRIGPMHVPGWGCEGLQKVFMWVHSCSLGKCSIPGQQNSAV